MSYPARAEGLVNRINVHTWTTESLVYLSPGAFIFVSAYIFWCVVSQSWPRWLLWIHNSILSYWMFIVALRFLIITFLKPSDYSLYLFLNGHPSKNQAGSLLLDFSEFMEPVNKFIYLGSNISSTGSMNSPKSSSNKTNASCW